MNTSRRQGLIGKTINGRFTVRKYLGGGSFGSVYEVEDSENSNIIALKFEADIPEPQLPNEYKCYQILEHCPYVPKAYEMFQYKKANVLAMDKMGPSLEKLFKYCGKKFSLKTTLAIADQMIRMLEFVHNSGIIHRDVKPHNFLIGSGKSYRTIFIIDFGISMNFINERTKEQIMFTSNNGLVGTAVYASINAHLGEQQSPRDDLESVMYSLIRFMKGSLPWQKLNEKSIGKRNDRITHIKMQTKSETLCQGLPREFLTAYEYIRKLTFNERPSYNWLRKLFRNLFIKQGFVDDGIYCWDDSSPIYRPLPSVFLWRDAIKFQRQNERNIKKRKEVIFIPQPRRIFIAGWRT